MKRYLLSAICLCLIKVIQAQTYVSIPLNDPNIHYGGTLYENVSVSQAELHRFSNNYLTTGPDNSPWATWDEKWALDNAMTQSGVYIEVRTNSPSIRLSFSALAGSEQRAWSTNFAVFKDGQLFQDGISNDASFTINNAAGDLSLWRITFPAFHGRVLSDLEIESGHSLSAYTAPDRPHYFAIGNSITHGVGQNGGHLTYPYLVADSLDLELHNLGIGASRINAQVLENLQGQDVELVTILWGYNNLFWGIDLNNTVAGGGLVQYDSIIEHLCTYYPETKVYAIMPTPTTTTMFNNNSIAELTDGERNIVQSYQPSCPNLHIVESHNYLTTADLSDAVHLNVGGAEKLANGLSGIIDLGPPCPKPDLGPDVSLCGVSSVLLNSGLSASGKSFSWEINGVPLGGEINPMFTASTSDTFKVIVDSGSCSKSDEIVVSASLPLIDLGPDQDLCSPSQITLDAAVSGTGYSYTWTKDASAFGTNSQTVLATEPGNYVVTVSASGCTDVNDQITITSSLLDLTGDTICNPGTANLSVNGSGSFDWFDQMTGGSVVNSGTTFNPSILASTTYYVEDASGASYNVGHVAPDLINGSYTWGNNNWDWTSKFEVYTNLTLSKVSVWSVSATEVTVNILASDRSTVLQTKTFTGVNNNTTESILNVDFDLTPGTYYLGFGGTNGNMKMTNNNDPTVNYPYSIPGVVSITNGEASWGSFTNWALFGYNWEIVTGNNCDRTPVYAVINPGNPNCIISGSEDSKSKTLALFPNPTTDGMIYLSEIIDYKVLDIMGKVIIKEHSSQIDLSGQSSGIYILRSVHGEHRIVRN